MAALSNVSEEIEQQYTSYSKLHLELKEKPVAAENPENPEEVKTEYKLMYSNGAAV